MTKLLRTAIAATLLPAAVSANPLEVQVSENTVFTTYGHVNLGARYYKDGLDSKTQLLDNSASQTRVGIRTDSDLDSGSFVFNFETGLGLPGTSGVGINDSPEVNFDKTSIRKVEIIWDSGSFGKFFLGQGSMASDGVAEYEYSGVGMTAYSSVADIGGGNTFLFQDGTASPLKVRDVFKNLDGARRGRIRYDSPSFAGFTIGVGYGQEVLRSNDDNDYADVALRYSGGTETVDVKGGIGYNRIKKPTGPDDSFTSGSIAARHNPSGVNGAFAAGQNKAKEGYYYLQIGIVRRWMSVGETNIALDYYDGNDFRASGSSSKSTGFTVVQDFNDGRIETYLSVRDYRYDQTAANFRDGEAAILGFRAKF